jgi:hypothetical protein
MFAIVGLVVVLNSQRAGIEGKPRYQLYYALAAGVMTSGLLVVAAHFTWRSWKPWNFFLESVEIVGFAAFWIVQTFELWDAGVGAPVPVKELIPGAEARRLGCGPATE